MDFFDRLYSNGETAITLYICIRLLKASPPPPPLPDVVKKSGSIVKCFDEMWGDFLVSDELKKVGNFCKNSHDQMIVGSFSGHMKVKVKEDAAWHRSEGYIPP